MWTVIGLCAIAAPVFATDVSAARASGYRLIEIRGDGSIVEHAPGPAHAPIDAVLRTVPHSVADDAVGLCGSCDLAGESGPWLAPPADGRRPVPTNAGPQITCVPLACDADVEFYETFGSVRAVEARINAIVDAVNVQFERDVGIRHEITTIIVRTAEPDPYSSYSGIGLAFEFRNHWLEHHADVPRAAALLFTGRVMSQNIVGWAWRTGSICTDDGFAVARTEYSIVFASSTDLVAHELGHLWDASHCLCGSPPYTMNPIITGANLFHPEETVPSIMAHLRTRACVSLCEDGCPEDCAEPYDGVVDVGDLLRVLADWGGDGPCSGVDLAALLAAWGACE